MNTINVTQIARELEVSYQQIAGNVGLRASMTPDEAADALKRYAENIRVVAWEMAKKADKYDVKAESLRQQ